MENTTTNNRQEFVNELAKALLTSLGAINQESAGSEAISLDLLNQIKG